MDMGKFQPPKDKIPDYAFLTLKPGDRVLIAGVSCRLVHVNHGKRRLSFTPADPMQVMPVEEMRNPVVKVTNSKSKE